MVIENFWLQVSGIFQNIWVQMAIMVVFATVHGYGAAWLAIRMLFRPYKAKKFLGITFVPQGMIPRHRDRLAQAIGNAVGNELMSHETVTNALFGENDFFRRKVATLVDSYAEDLLTRDFPSLLESLPPAARATFLDAISGFQLKISVYIANTLKSEETAEAVREFVERQSEKFLSRRVSESLDEEAFTQIIDFLENRVRGILQEKALEQRVKEFVGARIHDLANTQTSLGEMFTPESVAFIHERLSSQVQPIVHQLAEIATSDRTRTQISALVKSEINDFYKQLPFYQKFFVSRERLHREVDDLVNTTLPRKIEETLRGEAFATEAENFLNTTIDSWLSRPLPELVGTIAPEKLENMKGQISRALLKLVQGEEMQRSISAYLTDTLHKIRPHSLRAILERIHPEAAPQIKSILTRGLLKILQREETAQTLNQIVNSQIERLLVMPIGRLSDKIAPETVKRIAGSFSENIVAAAEERLPPLIQEFDIAKLVREKVDAYPLEKLEALVLSIAGQHLRTIELFGLLIGFFLGVGQAFFLWAFAK